MAESDPASEETGNLSRGEQRALYGRRKGRPLRPHQQELVDRLLPELEFRIPDPAAPFGPRQIFDTPYDSYWLEIGFGAGEHLAWQARANPDVGIIGCEPYLNGVARLLAEINADNLRNIRIFRDDARMLLRRLPDVSLARIFILFPDPWPKTRHHKRRIVGPAIIPHLARIMPRGSELRIATDDPGYKAWILQYVLASGEFSWLARRPMDWRTRPEDWPPTRYEKKADNAGRKGAFLRFVRERIVD